MKSYVAKAALLVATVVILSGLTPTVLAQYYWLNPVDGNQFGLEINKPDFDSRQDGMGFLTTSWFMTGQYYLGDKTAFVCELPISIFDYSGDNPDIDNEIALCNPYLGLKFDNLANKKNKVIGHVGFRLPFVSDDKAKTAAIGAYTNTDRFEAFVNDYVIASAAATYAMKPSDSLEIDLSVGGNYWLATGDRDDSEFMLDYNMSIRKTFTNAIIGGGFSGKMLTSQEGGFDEKTIHQIALYAFYNGQKIVPGLLLKFPLDESTTRLIDMVFGVRLIFRLE
jgi:hypothetical protein